ncbi:TonB-dependent receptor [Massilia kyonggiensis]|nr:TonB-dependent receptor [Massilia kyonggiensis]
MPPRPTILVSLIVSASALAQETPPAQVDVRGKASDYDPRRDDTASRIVVRHEDLVKYGDTNLLDALKRIPGVTVSGSAGRGGEVRLQGLGNGYTQVLVDGERMPPGFAFDTLAPDAVERIEVRRAASADLPTQAIAGTINIVLKKVVRTREREFKAGIEAGRDTRSPNASLRLADKRDRFSYSLALEAMRNDFDGDVPGREEGFDAEGRPTLLRTTASREHGHLTTLSLVPRLAWTLDGGDTLALEGLATLNRFRVGVRSPVTTWLGETAPYPRQDIRMTNDMGSVRAALEWVHRFEGGGQLETKFNASGGYTDNGSDRDAGGNPDVGVLRRDIDSTGHDRDVGTTGKATLPLWEGHALAVGWDAGRTHRDDARRERDPAQPALVIPNGDEHYTGTVTRLALYAQDEWQVTPAWSAYLGTRWEGVRIRADGARSWASVFSPIVQTLYKLPGQRNDRVRLAVARTYKAPGMEALLPHRYTTVNNSQVEPDVQGNPDLKPELALAIDAAYEREWAPGALFSVSASQRRIDDTTRNLVRFDAAGRRWVSQPENVGSATTRTLQLETHVPVGTWNLRGDVARNWSHVDAVPGPDNRLDQQVPLSANLGADWQRDRLSAGANFGFRQGGLVRVSTNQTVYLHAQRDLDIYASWKLEAGTQLRVTAVNVLGSDFVNDSSYATMAGVLRNRIVNIRRPSVRAAFETRF